jgi:glycosyltransferase involved in cell wall biosynthesis
MKRLAYASPVNPAPSGISDYSEELLPYLAQYADITLYLDDGLRPANPLLARHLELRRLSQLERDNRRRPFDAIIYHMGNSPAHAAIWRVMQRMPGVLVLHDLVLHHFMLQYYATTLGDVQRYGAESRRRYGADGARIAGLMMRGRFTEAAFELPWSEDVLAAAYGLIAHSRFVLERAAAVRPELPAALVPMGVPLPPHIPRHEARARLGLPQNVLLLASFGHINPYKRVDTVLRALSRLRAELGDVHYILVGSVSPAYDARSAVARAGLDGAVTITGFVERTAFEHYVAAADICVNLRHPTAGETSASLLRLLGAGKPTLVTATGSFTELPAGVAAQVDPDYAEEDLVVAYCRLLATWPALAAAMGHAAREYVAREHTLEATAAGYAHFLGALHGWGELPKLRAPLWRGTNAEPTTRNLPRRPVPRAPSSATAVMQSQSTTVPEAAPQNTTPVLQPLATALAELGATEDDRPLLEAAARALQELY